MVFCYQVTCVVAAGAGEEAVVQVLGVASIRPQLIILVKYDLFRHH